MSQSLAMRGPIDTDGLVQWAQVSCGAWRWHCRAGYEWLLDAAVGIDWTELAPRPGIEHVKHHPLRDVWRVQLGRGPRAAPVEIYAKVYYPDGIKGRIKRLYRGPAGRSEWQTTLYAERCGLNVAEALAYGHGTCGRSILLTEGISPATPLDEYWLTVGMAACGSRRHRIAARLAETLADLLARAHQSGFCHRDMHAANLLVRTDSPGQLPGRLYLLDLHNARIDRPVSDAEVVANIAQINQWFRRHAAASERLRFLREYCEARERHATVSHHATHCAMDLRALTIALARRARRHAARLWAKRDRRAMRDGSYFAKIRPARGWRGHVFLTSKHAWPGSRASTLSFARAEWRAWLADPLRWVDPRRHQPIKLSHSATICRAALPLEDARGGPLEVIAKRPLARSRLKRLRSVLLGSRERRAWRRAYALLNRDVAAARPLAVVERRLGPLVLDGVSLTECVTNARDLGVVAWEDLPGLPAPQRRAAKDRLIEQLARLLKRLYERGFHHRDLKAPNILVQADAADGPSRLVLIDMDGVQRHHGSATRRWTALARLAVSLDGCTEVTRTDRLRLLLRVMSGLGRSTAGWKALARQIESLADRQRRRKRQHQTWKLAHYGRT